jgi:hypothetical protein
VSLYGGKGSLWGTNVFTNGALMSASAISWINETNSSKSAVYRSGFTNQQASLTGAAYTQSPGLPSGLAVTLQDDDFTLNIPTLSGNTNNLTLKTNKTTGAITGSFANPDNQRQALKIHGVILEQEGDTTAEGFFLGTDQSGTFTLNPP